MDNITIIVQIAAVVLIVSYYLIILSDMRRKTVIITYSALFVLAVAIVSTVYYLKQKEMIEDMTQVLAVATIGSDMEAQLASSDSYEKTFSEISSYEQRLMDIKDRQTIIDKICGRSEDVDSLLIKTQCLLEKQKRRIQHLNSKSRYIYAPIKFKDASSELIKLSSDVLNRDYLNIGFKVDHSAMFVENNVVLVRIIEKKTDSILYQQAYVPKDSINSFVIPNLFTGDNVELQMGYISKSDTTTFHFITEKPYGK